MFERILASIKEKLNNTKILDRYILKQVIEMFLMGVFVFTTIIFASDTFITLIKQIAKFGIPFKVAFIMILLNLPAVIVMTIPMGVLLATVMTLNRLSLSSEITVMRACGIGLNRIAKPIFIFAIVMALSSFYINEKIVPVMTQQSTKLALWALEQKHVLDNSKEGTIQVLQAREGHTTPQGWEFEKGATYTVANDGQVLNTTLFDTSVVKFGLDLSKTENKNLAKEKNFAQLLKYLSSSDISQADRQIYTIELFDKIALPITTIVFVLLGVPLAITPPRVRYNRGFLFSILIIFAYYVVRALSLSFGEAGSLTPFLAAWLPNLVLTVWGTFMYYKKVYTIS